MSTLRMARQDNASFMAGDMAESSHEPGVTVVIPCLNERITIAEAVMQAKAALANWPEGMEVVVADNGSTDGSAELARAMGARVVSALERGYGAALQAGFAAAQTTYIVYADADLTYDFSEGPRLVQALRSSEDHDCSQGLRQNFSTCMKGYSSGSLQALPLAWSAVLASLPGVGRGMALPT
jgi:glycosyltransferase involved in cell wall biosynthesis